MLLECCGFRTNNVWEWSLAWRKSLFDWEKVRVKQLLKVVHGSCLVLEKVDRWVWKDDKFQEFSVNLAYGILIGVHDGDWSRMFKLFGRIKALPSVQVTAWRVLENKIATKVNLNRRAIAVGSVFYCFCGVKEEELNNLSFDCRITWLV